MKEAPCLFSLMVIIHMYHVYRTLVKGCRPQTCTPTHTLTADMEFRPEDTQEDWDTKQRLLAIYNARLDERERRRDFIKAQGLLNTRMLQVRCMAASCCLLGGCDVLQQTNRAKQQINRAKQQINRT